MNKLTQERIEELARQIRVVDPTPDTGYDWNDARADVAAPDWTLQPKE